MPKKTDNITEGKVVALIARGDTAPEIVEELAKEGVSMNPGTIGQIKKRNKVIIQDVKTRVIEKQASSALNILEKSRGLIEKRLDKQVDAEQARASLWAQYDAHEITYEEYYSAIRTLPELTITELVSVSKESFHQSQIESGKPTNISANPQDAQAQLATLVRAIEAGNEVELQRIVFNP